MIELERPQVEPIAGEIVLELTKFQKREHYEAALGNSASAMQTLAKRVTIESVRYRVVWLDAGGGMTGTIPVSFDGRLRFAELIAKCERQASTVGEDGKRRVHQVRVRVTERTKKPKPEKKHK